MPKPRASTHDMSNLLPALRRVLAGLEESRVTRAPSAALEAFRAELRRRECSAKYVREAMRYVARCLPPRKSLDVIGAADLSASLAAIAGSVSRERAHAVLNVFFGWLVECGDLGSNPMTSIPHARKKAVRVPRRGLTPEEYQGMCRSEKIKRYRRVFYAVAIGTALRCGVLASIRWADVDIERALVRYVTKKGDEFRLKALPVAAVDELRAWKVEQGNPAPEARVFRRVPRPRTFYKDLAAAGIAIETVAGRLDRHALRVSMCTAMAQVGVPLPLAQGVMDHSDVRLTAEIYTRFPDAAQRDAIERASRYFQGPSVKDQGRSGDRAA